jgi:Spy/CpxP family protein refolding chaperone
MSKKLIWLTTLACTLILGQPSFAECDGHQKHCQAHERFDKLATELELTPAQKEKIKAYKEQSRSAMKADYHQLKALRSQINELVKSDKMDETKLDALVTQVNKIKGDMLKQRIMIQHQMYSLLTEKQKIKYLELRKKWETKHHN